MSYADTIELIANWGIIGITLVMFIKWVRSL